MTASPEAVFPTVSVAIETDVQMRARDGSVLRANVYRPTGEGPFPVLLTRLPYGKDLPLHVMVLDPVAAARRGYIVVVQDVRGTFASEGEFQPFAPEYSDGAETVRWAASLPGSSGVVGMYGVSYFGFTQLAAAVGGAGELRALVPIKRCADALNGFYFRHGAFELGMQATWYMGVIGIPQILRRFGADPATLGPAVGGLAAEVDSLASSGYASRPLRDFAPAQRQEVNGTFFDPVRHPMDAGAVSFMNLGPRLPEIDVPALHVGGWFDIFQQQTIDDYVSMRARGVPTKLLVGPWSHTQAMNPIGEVDFGLGAQDVAIELREPLTEVQLRWYDRWLKGIENGVVEEPPVRIFVMGENRWSSLTDWPPPATETAWHLQPGGGLSLAPAPESESDALTYDPADPVPTRGGAVMAGPSYPAGAFDQRQIEARDDVLTYTTAPLSEDVTVIGRVRAHLWAATDAVDTDFVARLCDVHPDGRSINLADGIVRALYRDGVAPSPVEPERPYEYVIDLWSTANTFRAGHRIRVDVTSSSFPRWDANPNTGTPFDSADAVTAHQRILHDPAHPSRVVLPVVARGA